MSARGQFEIAELLRRPETIGLSADGTKGSLAGHRSGYGEVLEETGADGLQTPPFVAVYSVKLEHDQVRFNSTFLNEQDKNSGLSVVGRVAGNMLGTVSKPFLAPFPRRIIGRTDNPETPAITPPPN